MRYFQYFILTLIVLFFVLSGCRKERFTEDSSDRLEFSIDTLRFDTVFAARGSATRAIKVFNRHNRSIRIDEIALGQNSFYRMNVDGIPTSLAQDVEIAPRDSLYIFTEVEIDPSNTANPFIILDSIRFETNGNTQFVWLESFGQDAVYVGESYRLAGLTCNGGTVTWDDARPYVVLGFLLVDGCNLVINPGVDIHFQGGITRDTLNNQLITLPNGTMFFTNTASIDVRGDLGSPVRFLTDRIEPEFVDVPGQWGMIWLSSGSRNNKMNYAEIRNATIGVRVDSAADLRIDNSTIYETSSSAILGIHADISGTNNLIYDISINDLQLEFGGNYHFTHCTFANETNNRFLSHSDPVLRMSNYFDSGRVDANGFSILLENELNATFENCIFYGTRPDEILLDDPEVVTAAFNYTFNHCLIKRDTLNTDLPNFINPVFVENSDEFSFLDSPEFDYRLDSIINPAINAGANLSMPILIDLDGIMRDGMPDIGAYEFQE